MRPRVNNCNDTNNKNTNDNDNNNNNNNNNNNSNNKFIVLFFMTLLSNHFYLAFFLVTVCRTAKAFIFLLWASSRLYCHNN